MFQIETKCVNKHCKRLAVHLKATAGKKERENKMKTFFEVAFEVLGCAVLVIGMITIFAGAVLQESYKNYPPTVEEIAENPELARYAK